MTTNPGVGIDGTGAVRATVPVPGWLRPLKKLALAVLTVWLSTIAIFGLVLLIPGDIAIAIAGESATPELISQIRERLHLDVPPVQRYLEWLGGALTGNLGDSLLNGRPVSELILSRAGITLGIILMALALGALWGVGAAVLAVLVPKRPVRVLFSLITAVSLAMPTFWVGMVLIVLFAFGLNWFPAVSVIDPAAPPLRNLSGLVLPAVAMSLVVGGEVARQAYASLSELERSVFVTALRSKGLSHPRIVFGHTLRHAAGVILTVLGAYAARLMGIAVAVEVVFGIAGLGSLLVQSVVVRDIPVIQGVALVVAIVVVTLNLLTDALVRVLDPRKVSS